MSMDFPEFRDDQQMGEWFEANDVSASDLTPAEDVAVSADLTVRFVGEIYCLMGPGGSSVATAAPTRDGKRDLSVR
jgi:hypothetical protein